MSISLPMSSPLGSRELDASALVQSYLAAVATRLGERRIKVREIRVIAESGQTLTGLIDLGSPESATSNWAPARLNGHQHRGWSATLVPTDVPAGVPAA